MRQAVAQESVPSGKTALRLLRSCTLAAIKVLAWMQFQPSFLRSSPIQNFRARCLGVDLNRNWPMDYGARGEDIGSSGSSSCDDTYRGSHFFSEPEVPYVQ